MKAEDRQERRPADGAVYSSAQARFKGQFKRYFWVGAGVSAVLHILLILFFPAIRSQTFGRSAEELEIVDIPPEIKVPPPPEEIPRPQIPVVAPEEVEVEEEVTIAETTIEEDQPLPPPPAPEENVPRFIPRTKEPQRLRTPPLERYYPDLLKKAGITGRTVVAAYVRTDGATGDVHVAQSSGNAALDDAAQRLVKDIKWEPAYNRDTPVAVWVWIPIDFQLK